MGQCLNSNPKRYTDSREHALVYSKILSGVKIRKQKSIMHSHCFFVCDLNVQGRRGGSKGQVWNKLVTLYACHRYKYKYISKHVIDAFRSLKYVNVITVLSIWVQYKSIQWFIIHIECPPPCNHFSTLREIKTPPGRWYHPR